MIEWLRDMAERCVQDMLPAWADLYDPLGDFFDWLDCTGASPWRSVEDELPKGGWVWVAKYWRDKGKRKRAYCTAKWLKSRGFWVAPGGATAHNVTHWMPIPPLPQSQNVTESVTNIDISKKHVDGINTLPEQQP